MELPDVLTRSVQRFSFGSEHGVHTSAITAALAGVPEGPFRRDGFSTESPVGGGRRRREEESDCTTARAAVKKKIARRRMRNERRV